MIRNLLPLLILFAFSVGVTAQTVLLDFETPETSSTFQYFGSSLEPNLNNIIANPDPSGINTSSMVADFTKPEGAQTWAGAFAMELPASIDLSTDTDICVKVWFPEAGNLALKLETGTQDNWINTIEVTETQQWVEICYNTLNSSIEAPFTPAAGGVYDGLVLFYDFGTEPTVDKTMYFDDVVIQAAATTFGDVTFSLDMSDYPNTFTTPYVSGTFNAWSPDANPMEDPDGDNVWTATVTGLESGAYDYKFQVDGFTDQENFTASSVCVVNDGTNLNRRLVVTTDATLPTVCYNSCYACGEAVIITFNLGEAGIAVSPDGLFVAGGGNFGNPGDNPLSDDDMDGIHTASFEKPMGFSSYFTFTNGACPDWGCKEDISGQPCADPDNFNDRYMPAVMSDTIISTCFAQCTEDTNCSIPTSHDVTFSVDMNGYAEAFTTVYLAGTMNSWSADANPMDDADGDNVWTITINLNEGDYQYKFQLDSWAVQEEFVDTDPCTASDGTFTNRFIEVTEAATVCYDWNTCDACSGVGLFDLNVDNHIFSLQPSLVRDYTFLTFGDQFQGEKRLTVVNSLGQTMSDIQIPAGLAVYELNTSHLAAGIHFVNVNAGDKIQTVKIMVGR